MVKDRTKTAGRLSRELFESTDKYELGDTIPKTLKDLQAKMESVLEDGINTYEDEFFLVIESKREPLMQNVLRNYILHRISCPTPHCDQTAYHYDKKNDKLTCLWSIPHKEMMMQVKEYPLEWQMIAPEMTRCVFDFLDGTLFKKVFEYDSKLDKVLKEMHG